MGTLTCGRECEVHTTFQGNCLDLKFYSLSSWFEISLRAVFIHAYGTYFLVPTVSRTLGLALGHHRGRWRPVRPSWSLQCDRGKHHCKSTHRYTFISCVPRSTTRETGRSHRWDPGVWDACRWVFVQIVSARTERAKPLFHLSVIQAYSRAACYCDSAPVPSALSCWLFFLML